MKVIRMGISAAAICATALLLSGCAGRSIINGIDVSDASVQAAMAGADSAALPSGHTNGGDGVHDPSIIQADDGTYWIFGTHMEAAKSDDLNYWKQIYTGVRKSNKLFSNLFDDDSDAFEWVGKNSDGSYSVWAPCVIYNKAMRKYCMYFCTSSTYIKSSLCWATSDTIDGPYVYQGRLLDSGWTRIDANTGRTDIMDYVADETELKARYLALSDYNNMKWPNCIDPSVFYDENGKLWMVYGSWSGGIFLLQLDEQTGQVIHPERDDANGVDSYFGRHLVGGNHQSCEGPWITYDCTGGYYYLFVSYGSLNAHGGYQIRCFRSDKVEGPYVDASGKTLGGQNQEQYGVKMIGNYNFPTLDTTYMAPGHNSALVDTDGKMYLIYHQRFLDKDEYFEDRVHQLFRNEAGWLTAAPFETCGETLPDQGYALDEIIGAYYYLNHGSGISDKYPKDGCIFLQPDGKIYQVRQNVTGEDAIAAANKKRAASASDAQSKAAILHCSVALGAEIGSFSQIEGKPYVNITIKDQPYKGVMIRMQDEAGNPVMCFTACGDNNKTIWGVHYLKTGLISSFRYTPYQRKDRHHNVG